MKSSRTRYVPNVVPILSFDALNDPVVAAPNCCSSCGQRIDWSKIEDERIQKKTQYDLHACISNNTCYRRLGNFSNMGDVRIF